MLWGLTQFFLLFCVTGCCNAASGEANRSAVLLQKLLLTELHPDTAEEVQLFLQQVSNRKVRFTAWDFFTINYTALGSVVGAITTLLVILVQIQNAN
jgi:gustatory receptor